MAIAMVKKNIYVWAFVPKGYTTNMIILIVHLFKILGLRNVEEKEVHVQSDLVSQDTFVFQNFVRKLNIP